MSAFCYMCSVLWIKMYMYTINIQQVTLFNKDFSMILYFLLL